MDAAISREKQLKVWRRDWKIALIERDNPHLEDLAIGLGFAPLAPNSKHRRQLHRHPDESPGP
jgi:putative endonuclease